MSNTGPLDSCRVLVTREKGQSDNLTSKIKECGGIPVTVPLLGFTFPEYKEKLLEKAAETADYDWLILTSHNGVEFFFRLLEEIDSPIQLPRIAVIGKKTGETLEKYGFKADFIPTEFVAENFVKEFIPLLEENTKVLLPKGNRARSVIAKAIKSAGAHCEELILYETYFPKESGPVVVDLLKNRSLDVITFTSSSTVDHFMEIVHTHQLQPYLDSIIITVIGPIAEKTALNYGLKVEVCPEQYTVSAMIDSLAAYLIDRNNEEE